MSTTRPPEPERRLCSGCAQEKREGDRRRYAQAYKLRLPSACP